MQQGKSAGFVQDVKAAPQTMCVLSFDWQLNDMERFLTHNHSFGVVSVDTTFNLGDFYNTAITYPHLMLEDFRTRKSPQLLGAILIHQSVNFSSFNYFIGCHPNLRNLMAFGSDGDRALTQAFGHNFQFAVQLRCFVHFCANVTETWLYFL